MGKVERYSNYNALWRHPTSGGILYVGNATTAASRRILGEINVSRIVFCQGVLILLFIYMSFCVHII